MTNRRLAILLLIIGFPVISIAQRIQGKKPSKHCSKLIEQLSIQWKNDSMAKKGFRLKYFHLLANARIDSVSLQSVEEKLGKPNQVWNNNGEITYVYNYLTGILQSGYHYSEYVILVFDENKKLLRIERGDNDPS